MSTRAGYAEVITAPRRARRARGCPGTPPRLSRRTAGRQLCGERSPAAPRRAHAHKPRSRPVPTNKQRRQAAQRRLQRQIERRAELARKRRRNLLVVAAVVAVLVVAGAAFLIADLGGDDDSSTAAAGSTTASAPTVDGSDG